MKPFIVHLKAHKVMQLGCFFFHNYSLAKKMFNKLGPHFHRFYVLCICWEHKVRRLVFDNYQTSPVPACFNEP